jgi:hypothetical protein
VLYRLWYTHVMNNFEKVRVSSRSSIDDPHLSTQSLEMSQDHTRSGSDTLANYLALYSRSNFAKILTRSLTPPSFVSCHEKKRKSQLALNCREIERKMSSSSIQLARALALGWRENPKFHEYLKITRSMDSTTTLSESTEAFSKVNFFTLCCPYFVTGSCRL